MLRCVALLFIFIVSLHALSDKEVLVRANGFMKTSNKSNQFRAYNDYKNLYLRALMNGDKKLKLSALKGIVNSGEKLHIDISQYSDELFSLNPKSTYKAPTSKTNKTIKKNLKVKSTHTLKSIRWKEDRIVMSFDKKLRNNQINYFTLYDSKTKQYKYVFDVHASMLKRSQNLRKEGIDKIKLAQFNTTTLRLVIQNTYKLKISFKKDTKSLIVHIKNVKKSRYIAPTPRGITPKSVDKNKIIVIDAGHGGKDPGAVGYKRYREKIVVLKIAQELKKVLKSVFCEKKAAKIRSKKVIKPRKLLCEQKTLQK